MPLFILLGKERLKGGGAKWPLCCAHSASWPHLQTSSNNKVIARSCVLFDIGLYPLHHNQPFLFTISALPSLSMYISLSLCVFLVQTDGSVRLAYAIGYIYINVYVAIRFRSASRQRDIANYRLSITADVQDVTIKAYLIFNIFGRWISILHIKKNPCCSYSNNFSSCGRIKSLRKYLYTIINAYLYYKWGFRKRYVDL